MVINGRFERCCPNDVAIEYEPQRCQRQLARACPNAGLDMSQPTLVSGPQVMRRLSSESSEKARYSQVNAMLSYELKTLLFAKRPLWIFPCLGSVGDSALLA
jgi:hypothetical protein